MSNMTDLLRKVRRVTFLTGAGMSTESGLPDFRSDTGMWQQKDPMYLLSRPAFKDRPHEFYAFFRQTFVPWADARPHRGHVAIGRLEALGFDVSVITQNIDGLHQKAGSSAVIELHGHLRHVVCTRCRKTHPLSALAAVGDGLPLCSECKAILEPAVVLFGDALPPGLFERAAERISDTELLCVVGTSLTVSPVNTLIRFLPADALLAVINHSATIADEQAQLVSRENAGDVLCHAVGKLEQLPDFGYANDGESGTMF
jgi:NAD-dependent deacetylase